MEAGIRIRTRLALDSAECRLPSHSGGRNHLPELRLFQSGNSPMLELSEQFCDRQFDLAVTQHRLQ